MVDMANVIFSPDSAGIRKTHLKENWSRVFLAGKTESEDSSIHIGLGLVHRFDKIVRAQNLDFSPSWLVHSKKCDFEIFYWDPRGIIFLCQKWPQGMAKKIPLGVYIVPEWPVFVFSDRSKWDLRSKIQISIFSKTSNETWQLSDTGQLLQLLQCFNSGSHSMHWQGHPKICLRSERPKLCVTHKARMFIRRAGAKKLNL